MKINLENKQDIGASTTYHIHAIHQHKEKCREYNIPLCVAFVDYERHSTQYKPKQSIHI